MSDVIREVAACAQAIERALERMDPAIEVYEGILMLIGEFAVGADEWCDFDEGIRVDDETATRTSKGWGSHSVYGAETVAFGRRVWRIRVNQRRRSMYIGVSRNRDNQDRYFAGSNSGYAYSAVRFRTR